MRRAWLQRPALLLAGGLLASLFANGRLAAWPAAWLSGLLLVRDFRTSPGWRPWLFGGLGLFGVSVVAWFGLMPFPPPVFLSIQARAAALGLLPFALDRLSHSRERSAWWQTLVFPMAVTALELNAYRGSGTTWGALGYTQASFLPLAQLASVTGLWGIGFLVSWFAAWGNTAWEEIESGRPLRGAGLVYPAILTLVLAGGGWRLSTTPAATSSAFSAATVSPPDVLDLLSPEDLGLFQQHYMKQEVPAERLERIAATLAASDDELFEKTRREARRGASLVFWPEASAIALGAERHAELLAALAALADEEDVYLGASIAYIPDDPAEPNRNRILLLGPDGRAVGEYHKSRLIPQVEDPFTRPGTGAVAAVETALGRLGLAICYDLDDPAFVASMAGSGVELLVAPSGDWPAIKHIHAAMARLRAIEMGVPLLRPANHGLSQAVDTRGRAIASMDHDATSDRVLRATLQPGRVATPYARWGDVFPWLCAFALPPVAALGWWRARRRGPVEAGAAT
jgi:apolipoprotein N-acyltransferase